MNFESVQDRTRRREKIAAGISVALERYGYISLSLPIYEHYDLLKDTAYDFSDESIIRFVDRNTGKTLVLRPDFTPQVCRAVTGYMGDYPLPLRIAYEGEVFRSVDMDRGHKSEKYQIGWELFGGAQLCGDMEMLLLTDTVLKSIELDGCKFIVGDSAFLARVLELSGDSAEYIRKCVIGKKAHELAKFLKSADIDDDVKRLLQKLPLAFGGIDMLEELKQFAAFDKILSTRINYVCELFDNLATLGFEREKLMFDAAEAKGLDYYTGVTYEILHVSSGFSLGGGGRYDKLMCKFGRDIAACGMALNIDEIMRFNIGKDGGKSFDWLVLGFENIAEAEKLRREGKSVFFAADSTKKDTFEKIYRFNNVFNGGNQ